VRTINYIILGMLAFGSACGGDPPIELVDPPDSPLRAESPDDDAAMLSSGTATWQDGLDGRVLSVTLVANPTCGIVPPLEDGGLQVFSTIPEVEANVGDHVLEMDGVRVTVTGFATNSFGNRVETSWVVTQGLLAIDELSEERLVGRLLASGTGDTFGASVSGRFEAIICP
jgi:hypothetical protein